MVSSGSIPWYNRPARRFPAQVWLEKRYGFRLPPAHFTPLRAPAAAWTPSRDFPVKRWLVISGRPTVGPAGTLALQAAGCANGVGGVRAGGLGGGTPLAAN